MSRDILGPQHTTHRTIIRYRYRIDCRFKLALPYLLPRVILLLLLPLHFLSNRLGPSEQERIVAGSTCGSMTSKRVLTV